MVFVRGRLALVHRLCIANNLPDDERTVETVMFGAVTFAYQEIHSALRLYVDPLVWVFNTASRRRPEEPSTEMTITASYEPSVYAQRTSSVKDDWRARLPQEKEQFFRDSVRQTETSYNMLTVSLDEALALQQSGQSLRANEAVSVIPKLLEYTVRRLTVTLSAMEGHTRQHGTVPNVAPLNTENFQTTQSEELVRMRNSTAPAIQSRFLYKLSILSELIDNLSADFFRVASKIVAAEATAAPDKLWQALDEIHYDLNTCLRETIVMMKSFLMVLPQDEFEIFKESVITESINMASSHASKKERRGGPDLLTAEQIAFAEKNA
jgi:hypothetical protein